MALPLYLTPDTSPLPPTALLAAAFSSLTLEEHTVWQTAFNAGRHAVNVAILDGQAVNKHTLHKELDCRRLSPRRRRQMAHYNAAMAATKTKK